MSDHRDDPKPVAPKIDRESVNLNLTPDEIEILTWAAKVRGKTVSDFITERALLAAREALMNRVCMTLPSKRIALINKLHRPVKFKKRLAKLLRQPK